MIVFIRPYTVGVTFYRQLQPRIREHNSGNFGELLASARLQRSLIEIE